MNETLPRHIAIIMDGNGRWAKKRHLPRIAGHKAGIEAVRKVVKRCVEKKIEVLTLFAFGIENWHRPAQEVNGLMKLFVTALKNEVNKLHKQNIHLRIIGNRDQLSKALCEQIAKAEKLTLHNSGLKLVIAVNYSGRWDITNAVNQIVSEIPNNPLTSSSISSELIQSKLALADLAEPDLLIRTSGEQRISNFMLWQFAYTELFFTETFWPDFTETDMDNAFVFFANRERRFGYISEQLPTKSHA